LVQRTVQRRIPVHYQTQLQNKQTTFHFTKEKILQFSLGSRHFVTKIKLIAMNCEDHPFDTTKLWLESKKNHRLIDTLSCSDYEGAHSCHNDAIDQIIQYRLSVSPTDGFDTDFCGRSALHLAILRFNSSPEGIKMLYEANKSALQTFDFFGIAPISLFYYDSYPLEILDKFLNLCPEKFITSNESNSHNTILKGLDKLWSRRIQKESLTVHDLIQDPALRFQWEKFIITLVKVHYLLVEEGLISPLRSLEMDCQEPPFSPQAIAAIDLCGPHQLSTDLILFILQMHHADNDNFTKFRRLIHILSFYQPIGEIDDDGDKTLEAILLYRLWACPSEVFQSDACGRTPLYHLLKLRPTVRSLRIIYERDNYALTTPDFCGISPTALVYFREYPIYELKTLLNLHPEAFMGGTPQELVPRQSVLNKLISMWDRLIPTKSITVSSLKADGKLMDQWDKFMATIQGANNFFLEKKPTETSQLELHGALEMKAHISLPNSLISFIMNMYPSQLSTIMVVKNRRMLPLHFLIELFTTTKSKNDTVTCVTEFSNLLKTMLDLFPEAATMPHPENGSSLPLHMALEGNMTYNEGVSDIIKKFPAAIYISDEKSGLAPFMIASTTEEYDLDTVLSVLRGAPSACPTITLV
jgi:hypothetical protein